MKKQSVFSMVSLLEKVQLHRSSHRFEPALVTHAINLSHCCIVSTCVKASLTSNCRAATQSSQLTGTEAHHKTTNKGQMETENTHYSDSHIHVHRHRDSMGLPSLRICQLVCHMKLSHAAMGNSVNFLHTKYNRAQVLQTKGHAQKKI